MDHLVVATAVPAPARSRFRPGRWFLVFFVLGALLLVPVAMLSLVVPAVEVVSRVLTPGVLLLLPLRDQMAGWPGAANLLLGSVANGLVVGLLGVGACLLLRLRERRR